MKQYHTWCRFMLKIFTAAIYKTRKIKTILLVIYSFDEIIYFSGGKIRLYLFYYFYYSFIEFNSTCDSKFFLPVLLTNWLICLFIYHFLTLSFIYVFNYFLHTLFYFCSVMNSSEIFVHSTSYSYVNVCCVIIIIMNCLLFLLL